MACVWYNHHHYHYHYHDHELSYWGELRWNRSWWLRSPRFCKRNWILWLIWQAALSGSWVQCRVGDHSSFVGGSVVLSFVTFFNERLDTAMRDCWVLDFVSMIFWLIFYFIFIGSFVFLLNIFWAHFVNYGPSIRDILPCQKVWALCSPKEVYCWRWIQNA